jgi:hypothetical protein
MQPRIFLDDQPGASHFFIDGPTETFSFEFLVPDDHVVTAVILALIFLPIFFYDFYKLRRNFYSHIWKMFVRLLVGYLGATCALKYGDHRIASWTGILFLLFGTACLSVKVSFVLTLLSMIGGTIFSPLLTYVASFFPIIYQPKIEYIKKKIMGHHIVATQSIVTVDSDLKNVEQTIRSASALQSDAKSQLLTLFGELKSELEKVKSSHAAEVENVSDEAKLLAEKLNGASPTKDVVKSRAEKLVTATKALEQVLPAALSIAQKIHDFIAKTFA